MITDRIAHEKDCRCEDCTRPRFTRGPWTVRPNDVGRRKTISAGPNGDVAWVLSSGQAEANAALIAAAPALLDALYTIEAIMCDRSLCGHFLPDEIREETRAAINLATGGAS